MPNIAVIIPVYGRPDLTDALLSDLAAEEFRPAVYIVDNAGDYVPPVDVEDILVPGTNLGWAGGSNLGLQRARRIDHSAYLLLNNDVRLSPAFVTGLVDAWLTTKAGLLGPVYDHNWPHQRCGYSGKAAGYDANSADRLVPFVDGTCMLIPAGTLELVGLLDCDTWPRFGWGCDKDYALRVRSAGGKVWVTQRAYLNHFARGTAAGLPGYSEEEAEAENDFGMSAKWGPEWEERLYEGFGDACRHGLVQSRLRKMGRRRTS